MLGGTAVAVRDNETAAAVMGVDLVAAKAFAFGISGRVRAARLGHGHPPRQRVARHRDTLTVLGSITFLIIMVIGGAGSLWGPVIGAVLFVFVTDRTGTWANDGAIPVLRPSSRGPRCRLVRASSPWC
ncbi:MAG: hypothetical protein H6514_15405 [Acidimicrobiaceae bacterium]|nr:hypothetical protein [Acidimicrobiaceae bacterium]